MYVLKIWLGCFKCSLDETIFWSVNVEYWFEDAFRSCPCISLVPTIWKGTSHSHLISRIKPSSLILKWVFQIKCPCQDLMASYKNVISPPYEETLCNNPPIIENHQFFCTWKQS